MGRASGGEGGKEMIDGSFWFIGFSMKEMRLSVFGSRRRT